MKSFSKYAVFAATAVAAVAILAVPKAFAGPITGTIYQNTARSGNAGDPLNMLSTYANATFTVGAGGIDFNAGPSCATAPTCNSYTAAGFLNNPTFSNQMNGFDPNRILWNPTLGVGTEVVLQGSLFLNVGPNSFQVGHDDGVVLDIAGLGTAQTGCTGLTVVCEPGQTSFSTTPFTVNAATAGNYNFTLDYSECCGQPADLLFNINNSTVGGTVPEPNSLVLLGTGGILLLGAYGLAAVKMGGNA